MGELDKLADDPDWWMIHALIWGAELDGEAGAPPLAEDKAWWALNVAMWEADPE